MNTFLQVTIKFQVPSACEIPLLITNLVSRLGVKVEDNGTGSDMILRAWDRFTTVSLFHHHYFTLLLSKM